MSIVSRVRDGWRFFVSEFKRELATQQQAKILREQMSVKGKLVRIELQGVKVRAMPDGEGRTFTDPDWIPTHEPIEDLGILSLADFRPWHQRAWDRVKGKGEQAGKITVSRDPLTERVVLNNGNSTN